MNRREIRYCKNCKKRLYKGTDETFPKFKKRTTCNSDCYNEWLDKKVSKSAHPRCFCGSPGIDSGTEFCCWEHRIIAGKCKRWGIAIEMRAYLAHVKIKEDEQRELNSGGTSLCCVQVSYIMGEY
jgi:hypothetical protein